MNLFFHSSSYTSECILPNLCHILEKDIKNVYIFSENRIDINKDSSSILDIVYCNDLDEILKNSDLALIFDDGRISKEFTKKIAKKCLGIEKPYYIIDLVKAEEPDINFSSVTFLPFEKPCILICYDGEASQIEKIELSLNKLFFEKQISFKQVFSSKVNSFLNKLQHLISNHVNASIKNTNFDVLLMSTNLKKMVIQNTNLYKEIMLLRPDYVLFCAENNYTKYDEVRNFFKYKFDTNIDLFLISNFFTYKEQENDIGNRVKTSIKRHYASSDKIILYDDIAENIVYNKIISKITFPYGVNMCNNSKT